MLVIGRSFGQSVFIGDDVEVVVLEHRDGGVRLGIKAPRNVIVSRRELEKDRASVTDDLGESK